MIKKCFIIGLALFLLTFLGCGDDDGSAGSGGAEAEAVGEAGSGGNGVETGGEAGTSGTDSEATDAGEEVAEAGDEVAAGGTDGGDTDADEEMPDATTVVYKTVDGHEIHADVYTPTGEGTGAAILSIHGGGLIMNNRLQINSDLLSKSLAAGFAVVSIDYRLAPETKLPEIVDDVEDAYAWMREEGSDRFGFDADKISVMGLSAGGYLTLVAGYRFTPRPRALVSFYGYGDLTGTWYSQPSDVYLQANAISEEEGRAAVGTETITDGPRSRLIFYIYCRQQGSWLQEVCGHDPSDRDWYTAYEPLRNVSSDYPPTLLLHGEADADVPFEQSELMAEELARNDVVHELLSDPDWGHTFDLLAPSDPKVQQAIDRAVQFLVEHGK